MRPIICLAVAAAAAILFLGCGSTEEVSQSDQQALTSSPAVITPAPAVTTPTPTQPNGGGGCDDYDGLAAAVPPPDRSAPPVPEDWATFDVSTLVFTNQKIIPFTFRYPSDWHVGPGVTTISSWDPATWDKPYSPPNGIMVQFDAAPWDRASARPCEATVSSLGGVAGFEVARVREPGTAWARSHVVTAELTDYRMQMSGYFAEQDADETRFLQIVNSFRFTD